MFKINKFFLILFLILSSINCSMAELINLTGSTRGTKLISADFTNKSPLLNSFYFRFQNGDHNVGNISAFPERNWNRYIIRYTDQNNDDSYSYDLSFDLFPTSLPGRLPIIHQRLSGICDLQKCMIPMAVPAGDYYFSISGFRLYYANGDHFIDEIGIQRSGSLLVVQLNDKDRNDSFNYDVEIAWLPRYMVQDTGIVSGVNSLGHDSKSIPNQKVVISSFLFFYDFSDHKLKEFGILARPGSIAVRYKDENGGDQFRWFVWYTLLN